MDGRMEESMNKQTDREKAQTAQFRRLAAENADLRAEVDRLRDWMQRVTDAVVDWRTKVTGTAGSGCQIDAVVMLAKQWLRDTRSSA
jgi:cell division protein FtsB